MTSKQVKKAYKDANKGPRLTRAERLAQDRAEQARIRKELEKEKAAAKAKLLRDKKKDKEAAEKEVKKKKGLPLVTVRPSQDTIARFVRGMGAGKKRDCRGDIVAQPSPAVPTVQGRAPPTLDPVTEEPNESLQKHMMPVSEIISNEAGIVNRHEAGDDKTDSYRLDPDMNNPATKDSLISNVSGDQHHSQVPSSGNVQVPLTASDGISADLAAILGEVDEAELLGDYVASEPHERAAQQRLPQPSTPVGEDFDETLQEEGELGSPDLLISEPSGSPSPGVLEKETKKSLLMSESFEDLDPDFLDDMNTLLDVELVPIVSKSPNVEHTDVQERQSIADRDAEGKSDSGNGTPIERNQEAAIELNSTVHHAVDYAVAYQPILESPSPRHQPPPLSTQAIMLHVEDFFPTSSQQARELEEDLRAAPALPMAARSQPRHISQQPVRSHPSIEPVLPAQESRTPSPSPSPQPFFTSSGKRCRESFALHQQKRAAAMQALREREQRKLRLGREQAEERVAAEKQARAIAEAEKDTVSSGSQREVAEKENKAAGWHDEMKRVTTTNYAMRQDDEGSRNGDQSILCCSQETEYGGDWVDDLAMDLIL